MSELKEHLFVPHSELQEGDELTDAFTIAKSYYLKSEADKVIAEKDEKIEELEEHIDELQKATDSAWSKVDVYYDELSHSNHKRCLGEAKTCLLRHQRYERLSNEHASCVGRSTFERWRFLKKHYEKWYKRWLELAKEPTWAKFLQLIHKETK